MSGGWPSQTKKRGVVRAGARLLSSGDYTARVFCPKGLALTVWGPQAPLQRNEVSRRLSLQKWKMGVWVGAQRRPSTGPETGLKRQPQERQLSAAVFGGTRDRLPPARGAVYLARGSVTRRAETRHPELPGSAGLGERSEVEPGPAQPDAPKNRYRGHGGRKVFVCERPCEICQRPGGAGDGTRLPSPGVLLIPHFSANCGTKSGLWRLLRIASRRIGG